MGRTFSGRFLLRIAPALHERLDRYARERGFSLNQACHRILAAALAEPAQRDAVDAADGRGVAGRVVSVARAAFGEHLLGVVFFGSRARGEGTSSSDYDFLFVVDDAIPIVRDVYRRVDALLEDPLHAAHVVRLPESADGCGSVWLEAAIDGLVLHDPTGVVHDLLRAVRHEIARGGLVRKTSHGQPYWVREERAARRAP